MLQRFAALACLLLSCAIPCAARPASQALDLNQQAVVETSEGTFVISFHADKAPRHVQLFLSLASEGAYDGTLFHRVVKWGIVQGGDPLSRDAGKKALWGTGGMNRITSEISDAKHVRGTVSSVVAPGKPDSGGNQFFICVTPQAALDGQFTVFGRVVEGIGIVTKISEAPVDGAGRATERIEMTSVTIRDAPPAGVVPFSVESPAELAKYRAVLETSLGNITIEFLPDKAPNHVRNFLRLASAGVYDATAFHRVVPGFMIQTGYLGSKQFVMDEAQQALVGTLQPEFNDTLHDKGVVSMARGEDPASASTSFFIVTARVPSLDLTYTAFGRVVDGMSVVEAIEQVPRDGEAPRTRVDLLRVRVVRQ